MNEISSTGKLSFCGSEKSFFVKSNPEPHITRGGKQRIRKEFAVTRHGCRGQKTSVYTKALEKPGKVKYTIFLFN